MVGKYLLLNAKHIPGSISDVSLVGSDSDSIIIEITAFKLLDNLPVSIA